MLSKSNYLTGALVVRALAADDLPAVVAIQAKCYEPAKQESAASFGAKLEASPEACFLARVDGRPAGYLVAVPARDGWPPPLHSTVCPVPVDADALYLHDLAVLPAARGAGVAPALLSAFFEALRRSGFASACLTAVNGSVAFWQRQGFVPAKLASAADLLRSYGGGAQYMRFQSGAVDACVEPMLQP